MIREKCPYYPCHKGLEDCTYCYCPIYPCKHKEFGEWIGKENGKVWDCSKCLIFHKTKITQLLMPLPQHKEHSCKKMRKNCR